MATATSSQESSSMSDELGKHLEKLDNEIPSASEILPDEHDHKRTASPGLENGNKDTDQDENERPSKRQRRDNSTPTTITTPKVKPESPPWKKVVAEGPTSFTENGRRKSGRVNAIPLELQPPSDKRQTRGAAGKTVPSLKSRQSLPASVTPAITNGLLPKRPTSSSSQKSSIKHTDLPKKSSKVVETTPVLKRSHKKGGNLKLQDTASLPSKKTSRPSEHDAAPSTNGTTPSKLPRIRFTVRHSALPILHPDHIVKRPPLYESFPEYMTKALEKPTEDGGLYSIEDDFSITDEAARDEAQIILRLEEAAEGDGLLSLEKASIYKPEFSQDFSDKKGPLRQYARQDYLVKAMSNFRVLMLDEQKRHVRNAKMLAYACLEEYRRKQPKSEEELEAEAIKAARSQYSALVGVIKGTWENVRNEVNKRRLQEWEAEEAIRVRKALNEAVDLSTMKLEARRARSVEDESESDRELESAADDGTSSVSESEESEESEGNMSSESEAEDVKADADAAEDEELTAEELQAKYASLPELPKVESDDDAATDVDLAGNSDVDDGSEMDDSDESIDMDDDLGSSDEDQSDSDEDSDDLTEVEDTAGPSSLLGFFAPADVATITGAPENVDDAGPGDGLDDIIDAEDEVSLIQHTSDINIESALVTQPSTEASALSVPLVEQTADTPYKQPNLTIAEVPATTNEALARQESVKQSDDTVLIDANTPEVDTEMGNGDDSSQSTPKSSETKPSELDSTSPSERQLSRKTSPEADAQIASALKTPVPFLLRGTLREYQHYGLDWLAGLYANNTNGILADEMGLGKTIQTIALLAHLACEHQVWGAHLVIVPTSVMLNWEMEFKKWCPGFKILTYYGTQEERKRKRQGWQNEDTWNVVITSYQLVLQDQQVFKRRRWHYMILDEAHNIKNFRSQRWQTLLTFNTRARLLLTGTPLQNNLTELWSLLFFLMPSDGSEAGIEGFADLKQFSDWFRKPEAQILENGRETMDAESRLIISKLHKVLRPYLLRRLKADVEKQMPGKYEHVEWCRLSRRQRELYDGFLSRSDTRGTLASGNYLSIINCLMQLRKVCNHPDLFQERPIMSSFPIKRSAIAEYEIKDLIVRRKLLREQPMTAVSLSFLNMVPTKNEHLSTRITDRSAQLTAQRTLMDMREAQRARAQHALFNMDPSTVRSNLVYLESAARWGRFEELQHCVYLNALRRQQRAIYGSGLVEMLTIHKRFDREPRPRPRRRDLVIDWMQEKLPALEALTPTVEQRARSMHTTVQKFSCTTPAIVAPDALPIVLSRRGLEHFQTAPNRDKPDPFHEARMRLSVQFPDKRLLQYDCGKLQALDKLLRRLQSGGHRALIFTQMTKVLDILEQFLNIHGHRYLRLDGSTKIEQRQSLTDRFNNDTRILAFILSSRSGGLGINLTGADTVIFYDLDWNPAMDKQCQDRAHRIGQTRDVHIYRLVSEHTIEANILRKANQKRMLDDVVIQEGEFTTDHFNKSSNREVLPAEAPLSDADAAANAAMDRVLGGPGSGGDATRAFAQAEDQEDVAAAKVAQQEIVQTDAADFDEKTINANTPLTGAATPIDASTAVDAMIEDVNAGGDAADVQEVEISAYGEPLKSVDDFMLSFMTEALKDTPLELPKDKNRSKRGKDHRRTHRAR